MPKLRIKVKGKNGLWESIRSVLLDFWAFLKGKSRNPGKPPNNQADIRLRQQPRRRQESNGVIVIRHRRRADANNVGNTSNQTASGFAGSTGNSRVNITESTSKICKTCKSELTDSETKAICSVDASHQIHEACRTLAQNKCPDCKNLLL